MGWVCYFSTKSDLFVTQPLLALKTNSTQPNKYGLGWVVGLSYFVLPNKKISCFQSIIKVYYSINDSNFHNW